VGVNCLTTYKEGVGCESEMKGESPALTIFTSSPTPQNTPSFETTPKWHGFSLDQTGRPADQRLG
jgi:hypothetical protein